MIIAGHEIDEKTIKEMAEGARAFGNLDPWDYKRHCLDDAAEQVKNYVCKRFGDNALETESGLEFASGVYKAVIKEIGF